jgi:polar amino acid transport system permease protein
MGRTFGFADLIYLLQGAEWTVALSAIAFVGGGVLGVILAVGRISSLAPVRVLCAFYIHLIQAIPLLMLLFVAYFGFSLLGLDLPALLAAGVVMTLYASAFLGEIWRGCLQAIPRGQYMAGEGLGLSRLEVLRHVVAPQAIRIAVPPTVGFLVQIIKNTSVTALIGFIELARAGQLIANATFQPGPVFTLVALFYFVVCFPLSIVSRKLEKSYHADRPGK